MMENKGTQSLSGAELSDSVTINKWCKIISFHPNISSPVNDLLNGIPIDQTVSANNSYNTSCCKYFVLSIYPLLDRGIILLIYTYQPY